MSLIPDNLKEDVNVQRKTEKILLTTHRELVNAWGMNKVKAKSGAEAIKDKFEAMEEKAEKKETSEVKKKPKKSRMKEVIKLGIMYRDGANYKTHFTHEIDLKAFPKAKKPESWR